MSVVAVALAWGRGEAAEGDGWMTPTEREVIRGLAVPKRAADWRVGRWVAKEAVMRALGAETLDRGDVEVLAGPGGGPEARVLSPGAWPAVRVSLSHAGGMGFAAAGLGEFRLGCDVEEIASRSDDFVADYLTGEEASWVRAAEGERQVRATLLWSAKEAALKALGEGLRLDTRSVAVTVEPSQEPLGWGALRVRADSGDRFSGCWRVSGGFVWTVVADAAIALVLVGIST